MRPGILGFGDDRSPAADLCWMWINSQRWDGWSLAVITAVEAPIGPPPPEDEARLHAWEPPDPRVPSAESGLSEVVHLTALLDPRLALASAEVALLAIGPRGPSLLKGLHLGSTAEWLLQHPPMPLVVAKAGQTVRSAIVCHDGSAHATRAATALAEVPWIADTAVTVLAVDDGRTDAAAAAATAAAILGPVAAATEAVVRTGKPTPVIVREIEQRSPDLVCLGTRGLTGLRRIFAGSTAAAVARVAPCSVLAAHEGDLDQPATADGGPPL